MALGGAGVIGQLSHPPGDDRRAELTYVADQAIAPDLDAIAARLTDVGATVDRLSGNARSALAAVAAGDVDALAAALDDGAGGASSLGTALADIQAALSELPGADPTAPATYANATLVRRAALIAAFDSVGPLADDWSRVSTKARDAAALQVAIRDHDSTVAQAATLGVAGKYADAITLLGTASGILDQIVTMRQQYVAQTDVTVLDTWIGTHRTYDDALTTLYTALKKSGGKVNPAVAAAYRAENAARDQLPPDNRSIIVIVSEIAAGGLNQAVVAIEDARGRIELALQGVTPG
jgi:hypothetical protein